MNQSDTRRGLTIIFTVLMALVVVVIVTTLLITVALIPVRAASAASPDEVSQGQVNPGTDPYSGYQPDGQTVAHGPGQLPQIVLVPTDVKYVRALTNMNIRHGPSTYYPVVGKLLKGREAAVIAVTQDGGWWSVVCPAGVPGDCFVSANRAYTIPVNQPGQQVGNVVIESLEVRVQGSNPVRVQAVLQGYLTDTCTAVYSVSQAREGTTLRLTLGTSRTGQICAPTTQPYYEVVDLDVSGWPAGRYSVAVNHKWTSFDLPGTSLPPYDVVPTDVQWVYVRTVINVREGPGTGYRSVGAARAGEIAQVTGVTRDGSWWRIDCTNTASRQCFISAQFADPTEGPGQVSDQPVPYVMVMVDLPIYEGPGTQYLPAGMIYAGMMAKVVGVSPDGGWWRIQCTETTARECYISRDAAHTQPAGAP